MTLPCEQEDRITRIENTVEKVATDVATIGTNVLIIKEKVEEYGATIKKHDDILRGEGGDLGLVAQTKVNTRDVTELVSALKGEKDEPGLISVIADLAKRLGKKDDWEQWLYRLVGAGVITGLIALGFKIFGE